MRSFGQVARTVHDGVPVASIVGDVDAANASEVHHALLASVENADRGLVLDLARTRYMDSAGINVLFELATQLQTRRQALHLAVSDDVPVRRVLALSGVETTVPVHPTVGEAIEALKPTPSGEGCGV